LFSTALDAPEAELFPEAAAAAAAAAAMFDKFEDRLLTALEYGVHGARTI
jgi:hypothetical protein